MAWAAASAGWRRESWQCGEAMARMWRRRDERAMCDGGWRGGRLSYELLAANIHLSTLNITFVFSAR